eukprot:TRINITY_DN409_c0_g1_i2.p3 TRINITY_DN409_c0_g1~~TRINITY_DN409_c0_g1_i2.p3  ORF type:complete len:524 (-),score=44.47 TRINITY_DN409_c0_g1_i2:3794-5365(-)
MSFASKVHLYYFWYVKANQGPGLMLEPDQKGTIVGITCGTGAVLFLDLAMYLLRMNIQKVGRTKKKHYSLYANETFDRLNDRSFKLILFSCFKEKGHVLGQPIFQALHNISEKYMLNNFEYHLRISETGEPRWDETTFKQYVPKDAKKVIVFGPYGAEDSLKGALKKIGIKDEQFHPIQISTIIIIQYQHILFICYYLVKMDIDSMERAGYAYVSPRKVHCEFCNSREKLRETARKKLELTKQSRMQRYFLHMHKWIATIIDCYRSQRIELLLPEYYDVAPEIVQAGETILLLDKEYVKEVSINLRKNEITTKTLVPRKDPNNDSKAIYVNNAMYVVSPETCERFLVKEKKWTKLKAPNFLTIPFYMFSTGNRFIYAYNGFTMEMLDILEEDNGWSNVPFKTLMEEPMRFSQALEKKDKHITFVGDKVCEIFKLGDNLMSMNFLYIPANDLRATPIVAKGKVTACSNDFEKVFQYDLVKGIMKSVSKYWIKKKYQPINNSCKRLTWYAIITRYNCNSQQTVFK